MPTIKGYGRPYKELPRQKLFEEWLAAFKAFARDPCDTGVRIKLNDLTSEFHLRGWMPPYYQAKIEAYELIRAVDAALEVLRNEYPRGWVVAMRDLQSAINGGAVDGETSHPVWSRTRDEPLEYFPRSAFCERTSFERARLR
jgi:hypothetical protein